MADVLNWKHLLAGLALLALAGCSSTGAGFVGPVDQSGTAAVSALTPIDEPGKADPNGPRKIIEHPTLADLAVAGPLGDRFLGRPDAPVTVVEFASLTCPHCRAFHANTFPEIKTLYVDTGKVKWILREFPIGHTSGTAWTVNRCAPEAKYFSLYETFLREQASWVSLEIRPDAIYEIAKTSGMTRAEFDRCLSDPQLNAGLKWVKGRGRELGVAGTPTFFVGEQKLRGEMTLDEFKALVEPQLDPARSKVAAASAG